MNLRVRVNFSSISELARRAYITRIPVSAHTLRHTFARGISPTESRQASGACLLGHESLDTTAIYVLPSDEDLAAELERSSYNVDV